VMFLVFVPVSFCLIILS